MEGSSSLQCPLLLDPPHFLNDNKSVVDPLLCCCWMSSVSCVLYKLLCGAWIQSCQCDKTKSTSYRLLLLSLIDWFIWLFSGGCRCPLFLGLGACDSTLVIHSLLVRLLQCFAWFRRRPIESTLIECRLAYQITRLLWIRLDYLMEVVWIKWW